MLNSVRMGWRFVEEEGKVKVQKKKKRGRGVRVENVSRRQEEEERKWRKKGKGGGERGREREMEDVGARGRTEGDSGEKESGSEERTTMWKRRKKRVMRRDGERDTRGRSKRGIIMEVWRAALPGAKNQITNQIRLQSLQRI